MSILGIVIIVLYSSVFGALLVVEAKPGVNMMAVKIAIGFVFVFALVVLAGIYG